ncbi:hypothetical protein PV11_10102 [Exophiala sideris]|uniref:Uncharacterized protein n=1 Tax=Exophiala sideris TaxID=1016849 RepID=A0A0D1VQN3_9EURO|nr:hypothetical protein PV11_10102 [Exophiala sideris]
MCFRTEEADPTQQPIRVVQSHEAHDSVSYGETTKARNKRMKSHDIATEEDWNDKSEHIPKAGKRSVSGFEGSAQMSQGQDQSNGQRRRPQPRSLASIMNQNVGQM